MSNRKLYEGKVFFTNGTDSYRKYDMLYLSECEYYNLRTQKFVFSESSSSFNRNLTDLERKFFEGGNHCYEPEIYRTSQDIVNKIKGVVGELRSPLEAYALISKEITMVEGNKRYALHILKLENVYKKGVSVWKNPENSLYTVYEGEVYTSVSLVENDKVVLIARTPEDLVELLKPLFPNCIHDDLEDLDTSVTCPEYIPAVECLEDLYHDSKPLIFIKDYTTSRSAWEALVDEGSKEYLPPKFAVSVSSHNIESDTQLDTNILYFNSLYSAVGYFEYTLQSNDFSPHNLKYSNAVSTEYCKPLSSTTYMKAKLYIEDDIFTPQ